MVVSAARLRGRREYPGTIYVNNVARQASLTGAEWRRRIVADGLRLEPMGDGSLHAYLKAELRFEVYEDGVPAVLS